MIREEFLNIYWRYYELLETNFKNSIRYVSLDESNYNTYSMEYAHLLQTICSEIDVIFKELCAYYGKKESNITGYANTILNHDKIFTDRIVCLKMYHRGLEIMPFEDWKKYNSPFWWTSYNEIKHNRKEQMTKANLKNVLYSLAGLFLLENFLLEKIIQGGKEEVFCVDYPSTMFYIK